MHKVLGLIFSAVLFLTISCGKDKNPNGGNTDPGSNGVGGPVATAPVFTFSNGTYSKHKSLLQNDLKVLSTLNFSDTTDKEVLGIDQFSSVNLTKWLSDRIKFIVHEDFNWANATTNAGTFSSPSPFNEIVTMASNIGAAAYLYSKKAGSIQRITIDSKSYLIKTPRIGIIKVGEGLFDSDMLIGDGNSDSFANSLLRLSTLFHEARHSDGNGTHASFPHEICASGDYKGEYACENSTNGPYGVSAAMFRKFVLACHNCTAKEKQDLTLSMADQLSRIQAGSPSRDPRPEAVK